MAKETPSDRQASRSRKPAAPANKARRPKLANAAPHMVHAAQSHLSEKPISGANTIIDPRWGRLL
jgi:hypothetical protein